MAAPKKNEFWKQRSKHGRDKIFSSPEVLMEAAKEYFQYVIDNPLYETIVQSGKEFTLPKMRAMSIEALCIFLDISTQTFHDYADNKDGRYKDFIDVTTRIKEVLKIQKFEGAAAGFLNANIIARDLGLKEQTDNVNRNTSEIIVQDKKTADQLNKLINEND
jgi:hypothetical protein